MAITSNIDKIVNWFQTAVCPHIQLKVPDDYVNDGSYGVEITTPTAFAMYVPTKDKKPPDVKAPIPSICVQVLKGKDSPAMHMGKMTIQLAIAAWNPGVHGSEKVKPVSKADELSGYFYTKEKNEEFERSYEGWRDVWNFTDMVVAALENTEYIADMRLIKENDIEYGPFTEDGAIMNYYPYWFSWVQFTLEYGLARKIPDAYKDFL